MEEITWYVMGNINRIAGLYGVKPEVSWADEMVAVRIPGSDWLNVKQAKTGNILVSVTIAQYSRRFEGRETEEDLIAWLKEIEAQAPKGTDDEA